MVDIQQIETRDGCSIAFKVEGTGPAKIALVHSLAMDHRFWQPVVDRLAPHATVLTLDCRGHGQSDKPTGPYTPKQFADDLCDIFDHLGWAGAVVAGASMGGFVAQAFAAHHADRTLGLGLYDTSAWYGPTAPQDWEGRAAKGKSEGLASLVGFQKTRWFGDAFREQNPEVVSSCVDIFLANDIDAYVETCRMLGNADLRSLSISIPTDILVGEEDYATPPAMAEALHAAIPGSTYAVIGGGRHLTPLEFPDRIAASLLNLTEKASHEV